MQINSLIYFFAFIFGVIIGSFLNVVIYRLRINARTGRAKIDLSGRSKCPKCGKTLDFLELIPLISFAAQKGRCRSCHKSISWRYPLVELISGLVTFLSLYILGIYNLYTYLVLLVLYLMIVIVFYDFKKMIIPDVLLYPLYSLVIILDIIKLGKGEIKILDLLIGLVIGGGLFMVLVLISKEKWMGCGDVKLGFALGLFLSYPLIVASYVLSFSLGALISLLLLGLKGKTLKDEVPFAPFLALGMFIAVFWGEKLINWYLQGF
jgi:leader peptidase (prepilin peptidase)/N-methyltransferase